MKGEGDVTVCILGLIVSSALFLVLLFSASN